MYRVDVQLVCQVAAFFFRDPLKLRVTFFSDRLLSEEGNFSDNRRID